MLAFIQRGNKATKAGEFGVDGKTSDNYFETATDCPMIKSSCRHVSEKAYAPVPCRNLCVREKLEKVLIEWCECGPDFGAQKRAMLMKPLSENSNNNMIEKDCHTQSN